MTLSRARSILSDGEIRFTQPQFLNDPHELNIAVNAESAQRHYLKFLLSQGVEAQRAFESAKNNIVSVVISHVERLERERRKLAVLSLTQRPDNMLMWAHYGDEHRGAVIEFDVGHLLTPASGGDLLNWLAPVEYVDKRIDFIKEEMQAWETLCFKSRPWEYEAEWRMLRTLNALRQKTDTVFVSDLPPGAIKRVIFGAHAMAAHEAAIYEIVKGCDGFSHVSFEKAMFGSSLATLEFVPFEQFGWKMLHGDHHFGDNWRLLRQWVDMDTLQRAESGDTLRVDTLE